MSLFHLLLVASLVNDCWLAFFRWRELKLLNTLRGLVAGIGKTERRLCFYLKKVCILQVKLMQD